MTALQEHHDLQDALQGAHAALSRHYYDRTDAYYSYDEYHAHEVAAWYIHNAEPAADLPPSNEAIKVYGLLREQIALQFDYLTREVGIKVRFTVDDPYTSSADMFNRFFSTGALTVFKTQPGLHPIWSDEDNDRFRAVHDLLGHCTWLNSFGPKGEDAAYLSHIATLPRNTWAALCSETRGQNATYNYGHLIDGRQPFQYARQSWELSPAWVYDNTD